jgi:hypothetical protein
MKSRKPFGFVAVLVLLLVSSFAIAQPAEKLIIQPQKAADAIDAGQVAVDDLEAQRKMASSADRLVTATWWQIAIGAVSMAGLLWTLAVTRSAARMQLRAYIVVELYKLDEVKAGEFTTARMNIKNVGSTPAYELSSNIESLVVSLADSTKFAKEKIADELDEALTIAPGRGHGVDSDSRTAVTAGEIADIISGDKIVLVRGTVRYKDVFGKVRRTYFTHLYRGPDPAAMQGGYHPQGNHAD